MNIPLPAPISSYFAAMNARDADAAAAAFAETALVRDEGKDRQGRAAIRDWARWAIDTYDAGYTVRSAELAAGTATVVANVAGTFPGSPADITFRFTLEGDSITGLVAG